MLDNLLQTAAPHYCYGCAKTGYVLCHDCKYDIIEEASDTCLVCSRPATEGVCGSCKTTYDKAWYVGDRTEALERMIDAYKFERVKAAARTLAVLLDARLPVLPDTTVIVPVPTIRRHVRQRGYDHTLLLARELAKLRNVKVDQLILRKNNGVQRGLTKKQRFEQAKTAFYCEPGLKSVPYLVLDDVVTTNATLQHAAGVLRGAGADTVWVGVVAKQGLKK